MNHRSICSLFQAEENKEMMGKTNRIRREKFQSSYDGDDVCGFSTAVTADAVAATTTTATTLDDASALSPPKKKKEEGGKKQKIKKDNHRRSPKKKKKGITDERIGVDDEDVGSELCRVSANAVPVAAAHRPKRKHSSTKMIVPGTPGDIGDKSVGPPTNSFSSGSKDCRRSERIDRRSKTTTGTRETTEIISQKAMKVSIVANDNDNAPPILDNSTKQASEKNAVVYLNHDETWHAHFESLLDYKEKHDGSTRVPQTYDESPKLGRWVHLQRTEFAQGTLSKYRNHRLNSIGFTWQVTKFVPWEEMYQRLVAYKKKCGTTMVPRPYFEDLALGYWVYNQRNNCKKKERIQLLNDIDFVWRVKRKSRKQR